jgi:hypothetical protein
LFTTVAGRDLIASFDLPRAESSFALTPKPVAATTTAIAPKDANIDFALIVKPPFSYAPTRYHAGREIKHRTTSPLTDGAVEGHIDCQSAFKFGSDAILVQLRLLSAD